MDKKLFLLIHGIGSDKGTWNKLIQTLENDTLIDIASSSLRNIQNNEFYYDCFEYDSPIYSWTEKFKLNKFRGKKYAGNLSIKTHANTLKGDIESYIDDYSEIFIISHSMGGLITLELLFDCFSNNDPLLEKITKIIMLASPLAGSDNSDDIKNFLETKALTKKIFSYAVMELAPKSDTIINLHQKIAKYIDQLKELDILFYYASLDNRIIEESKQIANAFADVKTSEDDHTTIKEPTNSQDPKYKNITKFLKNTKSDNFDSYSKKQASIQKLEKEWHDNKKNNASGQFSHIIQESHYTHTIYSDGIYICNLKYKLNFRT